MCSPRRLGLPAALLSALAVAGIWCVEVPLVPTIPAPGQENSTAPSAAPASGTTKREAIERTAVVERANEFWSNHRVEPAEPVLGPILGGPRVVEVPELADNVTERGAFLKKTTRELPQAAAGLDEPCCSGGSKSTGPIVFPGVGSPASSSSSSRERVNSASENNSKNNKNNNGNNSEERNDGQQSPRSAHNRPLDDRYNLGWRNPNSYNSNGNNNNGGYHGNRDKNYYDNRQQQQLYDRYASATSHQRPSGSTSVVGDGDRFGGDRLGTGGPSGPIGTRPAAIFGGPLGYGPAGYPHKRPPRPAGGYPGPPGVLQGDEDDYPFGEGPGAGPGTPGGDTSGSLTNLQTQKAVALKALAGVALIGAAAALASNPILLPISLFAGRKKRSAIDVELDNFPLRALLHGYIQPAPAPPSSAATTGTSPSNQVAERRKGEASGERSHRQPHHHHQRHRVDDQRSDTRSNSSEPGPGTGTGGSTASQQLVISPECVARLACNVHRDYLEELERNRASLVAAPTATKTSSSGNNLKNDDKKQQHQADDNSVFRGLENWFDSLIHSNILVANYVSDELKSLIREAVAVGSDGKKSCETFSCLGNAGDASGSNSLLRNNEANVTAGNAGGDYRNHRRRGTNYYERTRLARNYQ